MQKMRPEAINFHDLHKYTGQTVECKGWVHGQRGSNKVQFLQIRNAGIIIQAVAGKEDVAEDLFATIKALHQETSVMIQGMVTENEKAPGGFEIQIKNLLVLGKSENYPITPKEHGSDFLHNHRHLWLRSKRQLSIMAIRNELAFAIREYFHNKHFLLIDTPILTGSVGESSGSLFATEYFDMGNAYLAQTGQLYLETAIFAHSNVYCFGPTFRAEKSKTKRHLTEFWMAEAEMAFVDNDSSIALQEDFVKSIIKQTVARSKDNLVALERDSEKIQQYLEKDFAIISYDQAIELLNSKGQPIEWGEDINAEGENIITEHFDNFVFIKNYPAHIKAFYMKTNPENPKTVLCADLIAPQGTGEIIGGSEREEDFQTITEKLRKEGLAPENYDWYLDLRKYGSVPHSGFGLGLERLVSWISGVSHVRECIPYPRMIYRLTP